MKRRRSSHPPEPSPDPFSSDGCVGLVSAQLHIIELAESSRPTHSRRSFWECIVRQFAQSQSCHHHLIAWVEQQISSFLEGLTSHQLTSLWLDAFPEESRATARLTPPSQKAIDLGPELLHHFIESASDEAHSLRQRFRGGSPQPTRR